MAQNKIIPRPNPKPKTWRRRGGIAIVVLLLTAGVAVGWLVGEGYTEYSNRQYLEERGFMVGRAEWGFEWYKKLAARWPVLKVGRVSTVSNQRVTYIKLKADDWKVLGRFRHIDLLVLKNAGITDELLAGIRLLPQLNYLDISDNPITDRGLTHLASQTDLRQLLCERTNITDDGLAHLAAIKGLTSLNISGNQLTGGGLKYLADLPKLVGLSCDNNLIDDEHLLAFKELSLLSLDLSRNRIDGSGLASLNNLGSGFYVDNSMHDLDLSNNQITDRSIANLSIDTWPISVNLSGNPLTNASLNHFAKHANKRYMNLDLQDTQVTFKKAKEMLPGVNGVMLDNAIVKTPRPPQ